VERDFLTMVVMLVVIEYHFYVTSKRLLYFNSTSIIIIFIFIEVIIIGGGINSLKIYFPKSDDDFKQLVGTVCVRTRSWPILMHCLFLVGVCGITRNFLRRIIGHGQELEPGFPNNKAGMLSNWRDIESLDGLSSSDFS
jgi:hypothetical protein